MPIKDYPIFQNVSLDDFKEKFDSLPRLDDKFDFTYAYLLSHGMGEEEPECTMEELLHFAKTEFIKASLAQKEQYKKEMGVEPDPGVINPYGYGANPENEAMEKAFLADPTLFLSQAANSFAESVHDDPTLSEEEQGILRQWKDNLVELGRVLPGQKQMFADYEKDVKPEEVTASISEKLYGRNDVGVSEFLDRHKGGLFERAVGSTSSEYKAFEASFKNYNDMDSHAFGDESILKSAAMGYIRHKFPNLKEGELPTQEQVAALKNPTTKGRIEFTVSLMEEFARRERIEQVSREAEHFLEQPNPEQQSFQENLGRDLEESEDQDLDYEMEESQAQVEIGLNQ